MQPKLPTHYRAIFSGTIHSQLSWVRDKIDHLRYLCPEGYEIFRQESGTYLGMVQTRWIMKAEIENEC